MFPVTLYVYGHDGNLLWRTDPPIEPYVAVEVPGFRDQVMFTVLRFGDGTIVAAQPGREDDLTDT
jgi:hypothetical protein